jgi:hypothetical protein
MIDSVCVTLPVRMHSPREMAALGFVSFCRHPSPTCSHPARWHLRPAKKPQLTWSEAPDRSQWLSVSGSFPGFMFGSNVRLFASEHDVQTCLVDLSHYVSDASHIRFDAFAANVTRVDYCHDWLLTKGLVAEYLWAFRDISLSRMKKHLIDTSTVELRNDSQTISFYDKFEERLAMKRKVCVPRQRFWQLREYFAARSDSGITARVSDTPLKCEWLTGPRGHCFVATLLTERLQTHLIAWV